jgi:hypothetical protein
LKLIDPGSDLPPETINPILAGLLILEAYEDVAIDGSYGGPELVVASQDDLSPTLIVSESDAEKLIALGWQFDSAAWLYPNF